MDDETEDRQAAPDSVEAAADDSSSGQRAPNTLLNGFIGGIVGIMLSFLPFSPVLGGAVAGYLEGGDNSSGAKVGTIAGLVAFVPFILIILVVLLVVPVTTVPDPGIQITLWLSLLLIVLFAAGYAVGLSILGGVVGVYVKKEL